MIHRPNGEKSRILQPFKGIFHHILITKGLNDCFGRPISLTGEKNRSTKSRQVSRLSCLINLINEYLQSLIDVKIVSHVKAFPKDEWTIRIDILYLMGHMHDKKSLRNFLDWLMEKEVQIKPPDYQIVKMVKRGTD